MTNLSLSVEYVPTYVYTYSACRYIHTYMYSILGTQKWPVSFLVWLQTPTTLRACLPYIKRRGTLVLRSP